MSAKKSSTSAKKIEPETFDTREVVLAKVRGFPPWPGMVVDPASVPKLVAKERPASKKSTVYAIRFFPAGDYAWLGPRELSRLTTAQINAFVNDSAKKAGGSDGGISEGEKRRMGEEGGEQKQQMVGCALKLTGVLARASSDGGVLRWMAMVVGLPIRGRNAGLWSAMYWDDAQAADRRALQTCGVGDPGDAGSGCSGGTGNRGARLWDAFEAGVALDYDGSRSVR
ncbi:Tudor/PWWP/MBT [Mycena venus]|uniref:Tudor/PWWP/MBT n=1 Tax=Mycena venus TaxID=2733690 RepID=A0A8H6XM14_9AGAR|nr:Tudor/PWWP/MBT [Mycena venus]